MRVVLYLVLGTFTILFSACKTPYFPLDTYKRNIPSLVFIDHDVKRVTEGYYQLDIYAVDTIYARKRIKYYTTLPKGSSDAEVIKSLYIYFIDEMRFVYTEKKFDELDVKKDVGGKLTKLGLYKITVPDSIGSDFFVEFSFAKSRVSKDTAYTYAILNMELSDNNDTLDFLAIDYPLDYKSRMDLLPINDKPFSSTVMDDDLEKLRKSKLLHYNSSEMQFHAQWVFVSEPVPTLIDGKPYNRILYQNLLSGSKNIIRTYSQGNVQVLQENIHEDRTKNNLITW